MTTWFTSDTHFFHSGLDGHDIITICKRPYSSLDEMHQGLINNWNSVVNETDSIYHLGDFAFKDKDGEVNNIFPKLNGIKHLIKGNHDSKFTLRLPWASISDLKEIKIEGQRIVLCHYALVEWNGALRKNTIHLHGHHHGNLLLPLPFKHKMIDVGVDVQNYLPISYETVVKHINKT